jgi:hypothetical protein
LCNFGAFPGFFAEPWQDWHSAANSAAPRAALPEGLNSGKAAARGPFERKKETIEAI